MHISTAELHTEERRVFVFLLPNFFPSLDLLLTPRPTGSLPVGRGAVQEWWICGYV